MGREPKGATVVKEEVSDEAGKKLREMKKTSKFSEFIATMKRVEEESIKPLSGDLEVIEKVSANDLKQLQKDNRLYGYEPATQTALVLKLAFLDKKKNKGE